MRKIDDAELLRMLESGMTQRKAAEHFGVTEGAISQRVKLLKAQKLPVSFEKLTGKEKAFVLAKVEGKTNLEAVRGSYDVTSAESAKSLGTKLMRDPDINECIHDLLAQEGIGRRRRIQRLRDLVESGNMTDVGRGLDMANKLTGDYAPQRVETTNIAEIIRMIRELKSQEDDVIDVQGT